MGGIAISPFDALQTLAEIAIGVAGFTGVISIFRRRAGGEDALSAWRTSTILTTSFAALALTTIPMGLSLVGVREPLLWRVCSAIYLFVVLLVVMDVVRRRRYLPEDARTIVSRSQGYARVLYAVAAVAALSQLLSIHPRWVENPAGFYFLSTLALIGASCAIFVRTLFGPHPDA